MTVRHPVPGVRGSVIPRWSTNPETSLDFTRARGSQRCLRPGPIRHCIRASPLRQDAARRSSSRNSSGASTSEMLRRRAWISGPRWALRGHWTELRLRPQPRRWSRGDREWNRSGFLRSQGGGRCRCAGPGPEQRARAAALRPQRGSSRKSGRRSARCGATAESVLDVVSGLKSCSRLPAGDAAPGICRQVALGPGGVLEGSKVRIVTRTPRDDWRLRRPRSRLPKSAREARYRGSRLTGSRWRSSRRRPGRSGHPVAGHGGVRVMRAQSRSSEAFFAGAPPASARSGHGAGRQGGEQRGGLANCSATPEAVAVVAEGGHRHRDARRHQPGQRGQLSHPEDLSRMARNHSAGSSRAIREPVEIGVKGSQMLRSRRAASRMPRAQRPRGDRRRGAAGAAESGSGPGRNVR